MATTTALGYNGDDRARFGPNRGGMFIQTQPTMVPYHSASSRGVSPQPPGLETLPFQAFYGSSMGLDKTQLEKTRQALKSAQSRGIAHHPVLAGLLNGDSNALLEMIDGMIRSVADRLKATEETSEDVDDPSDCCPCAHDDDDEDDDDRFGKHKIDRPRKKPRQGFDRHSTKEILKEIPDYQRELKRNLIGRGALQSLSSDSRVQKQLKQLAKKDKSGLTNHMLKQLAQKGIKLRLGASPTGGHYDGHKKEIVLSGNNLDLRTLIHEASHALGNSRRNSRHEECMADVLARIATEGAKGRILKPNKKDMKHLETQYYRTLVRLLQSKAHQDITEKESGEFTENLLKALESKAA